MAGRNERRPNLSDPDGEGAAGAYREPPNNINLEQALIGALLINNDVLHRIGDAVAADDFFLPVYGRIFDACRRRIESGEVANPVTLRSQFLDDEDLKDSGGVQHLAQLAASVVSVLDCVDYAKHIADLALRRKLIAAGQEMLDVAYDRKVETPAPVLLENHEIRLHAIAEQRQVGRGVVSFSNVLVRAAEDAQSAFQNKWKMMGTPTGFYDLDRRLGGLHDTDLIVLAGRPSIGKSALAGNIAFNAAQHFASAAALGADPKAVLFFSLEMSAEQVALRMLAGEAGVSPDKVRRGELEHGQFLALLRKKEEIASLPIHIDDTGALPVGLLHARARRIERRHGLGLVVVDYIQLARPPASDRRRDNRVQEVSDITGALKAMAKDLGVPVLALSQLSREVERREDKRPQLSDLRESGAIEQDADVVGFVYREEYYLQRSEPSQDGDKRTEWLQKMMGARNKAEVIIAKQRHGPIGISYLGFNGDLTRFFNLDPHHGNPPSGGGQR